MTVPGEAEEVAAVRKLVARLAPGSRRTYALGGTQKFELPCDEVSLSQVPSPPPPSPPHLPPHDSSKAFYGKLRQALWH